MGEERHISPSRPCFPCTDDLEPLIDDEDIIPEVLKKKGKKTSGIMIPQEATKWNPSKKRANGF